MWQAYSQTSLPPNPWPGRHLPEGHGEDGKEMKLVKLLSDLSAV